MSMLNVGEQSGDTICEIFFVGDDE